MAVLFGVSQGQVSHWVGVLTPLGNEALGRELLLPARRPADLEALLAEVPALRLLVIDGAERPVRRPRNKDDQKQNYRGKKKAHRKKNLLISSEKRVVVAGMVASGSWSWISVVGVGSGVFMDMDLLGGKVQTMGMSEEDW